MYELESINEVIIFCFNQKLTLGFLMIFSINTSKIHYFPYFKNGENKKGQSCIHTIIFSAVLPSFPT